jgi:hypothetical protein
MSDEDEMKKIIESEDQINLRVYKFPTSQIKPNNSKSSYFDIISSLQFDEVNEALKRIFPRIDLEKIYKLIDEINIISDIHKEFYKVMIKNRYEKIIKYSYQKLVGDEHERV